MAFGGFDIYFAPSLGYSWYKIKSMEIEKSFIGQETTPQEIDTTDTQQSVGSKSAYGGSGITLGGSAGIKIFSLGLGIHYAWAPVELDGYSKRYNYNTDLGSATGRKFLDKKTVDTQRILFEMSYCLPISRVAIIFTTRIGGLLLNDNGLTIGRATDSGSAFTGDLGLRFDYYPVNILGIGLAGWFGVFSFVGTYEGTFGTAGGLNGFLHFEI